MHKTLVVYADDVAGAIAQRGSQAGLPPLAFAELKFGLDEVMQLVNALDAELLTGRQATLHGLLDKLRDGWDVLWLITHGEPEGWYLNDGIVSASETTAMVRSSGVFLTVMNTCSSEQVARKIADELGTALVCTLSDVPDRAAFITGVIFAQKLAAGIDYETAYELAKPGQNSTYELIRARHAMPSSFDRDRNMPTPAGAPDAETLLRFMQSVNDLDLIVNGSHRLGLPALKDTTRELQNDLRELKGNVLKINTLIEEMVAIKASIANIERRQTYRNWLLMAMGIAIIMLMTTVTILVQRGIGV